MNNPWNFSDPSGKNIFDGLWEIIKGGLEALLGGVITVLGAVYGVLDWAVTGHGDFEWAEFGILLMYGGLLRAAGGIEIVSGNSGSGFLFSARVLESGAWGGARAKVSGKDFGAGVKGGAIGQVAREIYEDLGGSEACASDLKESIYQGSVNDVSPGDSHLFRRIDSFQWHVR